jgi:hypothetical protein
MNGRVRDPVISPDFKTIPAEIGTGGFSPVGPHPAYFSCI